MEMARKGVRVWGGHEHRGDVSSLLYATPPPSRSGLKAPVGGGGLAVEEGFFWGNR